MRSGFPEGPECGVCAADAPPLVGALLTGAGLTLDEAADALERGEEPPLTDVQRRLVEAHALAR
jgi:hypothetical protein